MLIGCAASLLVACDRETKPVRLNCINNLREIAAAQRDWAAEHKDATNVPTWADLEGYYLRRRPTCPAGGSYTLTRTNENPRCSIPGHAM